MEHGAAGAARFGAARFVMSRRLLSPRPVLLALALAALLLAGCRRAKVEPDDPVGKGPPAFDAEQLVAALSDDDPDIRSSAATSLATGRDPVPASAVGPLTKMLGERNADARTSAAAALGRVGKEAASAAEPLARLLSDPDLNVRRTAAQALGQIGSASEPAVSALGRALRDQDEDVRHAAADALGK